MLLVTQVLCAMIFVLLVNMEMNVSQIARVKMVECAFPRLAIVTVQLVGWVLYVLIVVRKVSGVKIVRRSAIVITVVAVITLLESVNANLAFTMTNV